jgi:AcrR family transcriptional regulator
MNSSSPSQRAPRQQRSIQRREQILDAARSIIGVKGYANLTISEIAVQAGVTASSMYQYFRNKTDIMAALQQQGSVQFDGLLQSIFHQAPANSTELVSYFHAIVQQYYQLLKNDPVSKDISLAAATDKEIYNLEQQDIRRTLDFLLQQSGRFFPESSQIALKGYLELLIHCAVAAVHLALSQTDSSGESTISRTQHLLAAGWLAFCADQPERPIQSKTQECSDA